MNRFLIQQGYSSCSLEELSVINYQNRVMPALCIVMATAGLILHEPLFHFFLTGLGFLSFISKRHHPVDYLFNKAVVLFKANKNISCCNPRPRRYACLMISFVNLVIGLLLLNNLIYSAWILGALFITLQLSVALTHFCLACWAYEQFFAFLGHGDTINLSEARELRMRGAILLDVRTPKEHQKQVITGAVNIPSPLLLEHSTYYGKEVIVFCNSGLRSKEVANIINKKALGKAYCLGSINNAIKL